MAKWLQKSAEALGCYWSVAGVGKIELQFNCDMSINYYFTLTSYNQLLQYIVTRRERLKSALYLRLTKRKTFFCEKLETFEIFFSFGKCHTVPKNVKEGTLFDL